MLQADRQLTAELGKPIGPGPGDAGRPSDDKRGIFGVCALHPDTPYTLRLTPCTSAGFTGFAPCTLHPDTPYTLRLTPYNRHPARYTLVAIHRLLFPGSLTSTVR